jgi:SAM-dependent methyltransferase
MAVPFDHIASPYGPIFAKSLIGQLQRKHVWSHIENIIPQLRGYEMLELHYGNAEDEILFNENGVNIVATDISAETNHLTLRKAEEFSMPNRISSHYLDLDNLDVTLFDKKFDLVFSNFGGVNCINPSSLRSLLQKLPAILNPGGRFVAVIMPKFCAWETIFFLLRLQYTKAFRRLTSKETILNHDGINQKMWFYHPSEIIKFSKEKFKLIGNYPIGIALPSSYLDNFFHFRKKLLFFLDNVEKNFNDISFLSGMADHFVIDLQLRK